MDVLISGASIAGPALAYWLGRFGFRPTIVEIAPALRTGGNAVDFRGPLHLGLLRRMGVLEDLGEGADRRYGDALRRRRRKAADGDAGRLRRRRPRGAARRPVPDAVRGRHDHAIPVRRHDHRAGRDAGRRGRDLPQRPAAELRPGDRRGRRALDGAAADLRAGGAIRQAPRLLRGGLGRAERVGADPGLAGVQRAGPDDQRRRRPPRSDPGVGLRGVRVAEARLRPARPRRAAADPAGPVRRPRLADAALAGHPGHRAGPVLRPDLPGRHQPVASRPDRAGRRRGERRDDRRAGQRHGDGRGVRAGRRAGRGRRRSPGGVPALRGAGDEVRPAHQEGRRHHRPSSWPRAPRAA